MAIVPVFAGRVTADAKLELAPVERALRAAHLRSLAGKDVEVIVRKRRKQRTSKQNAYLHAVVFPILGEFFGTDLIETKRDVLGECWGWVYNEAIGREVPIRAHTSELSDEEAAYLIDWVIPWALDKWKLDIPYPGEAEAA